MTEYFIGKEAQLVADGTALTGSYAVAGSVYSSHGRDQLYLLVDYTKGDETDMRMKVDFMRTNTASADRYQETAGNTDTSGVTTVSQREYKFTATGKYCVPVAMAGLYFEVSFKATAGTPTGTFGAEFRLEALE